MFWLLFQLSCIVPLEKSAEDFWDNPTDDHDEDGLTEQDGDCDDRNDSILGPSLWYPDADEDGFGDPSQGVTACLEELLSETLSYVANSDDCNDSDSTTYPGSSREGGELCVRDSDGDGFGDSTASQPYDAGTDCNDSDASTYPGSSQEGGDLCVRDSDGDGFGDSTASLPYDAGTDCNDSDSSIFPNNAQYEDDDLCVVDRDGDGYGDAIPDVSADAGHDCDDSNPLVYPGYNNEQGALCILDSDGDGFGQVNAPQPYDSGTDCDDSNEEIYPNQRELCDLIDNDCNGTVDDALPIDSPIWYVDSDGDGFGAIDYPLSACPDAEGNGPAGYVSSFSDCDDTHAFSHPYLDGVDGGVELCDSEGRDENCDGVSNDPSALDATVWYQDADSDGYGSVFINQRQCDQPSGYVEDNTDCNDSEPNSHPNNSEQCD
ncbi:MAG: MopE-related protein, partial [Myxococcota bacterium]|nr:MopE-related protein [Myxococcota bacterium]